MDKNRDRLLLVFIKNLEPGKVKTRLAKTLGNRKALDIYKKLLEHTCKVAAEAECDRQLWYAWYLPEENICNKEQDDFASFVQKGNGLGERMGFAFKKAFEDQYKRVVIIGSDCAQLQAKHIHAAFDVLENKDAVIGPADDGGYYLLGMNTYIPQIFKNINWSTATVLQETKEKLKKLEYEFRQLEALNDVDTEEDLNNMADRL